MRAWSFATWVKIAALLNGTCLAALIVNAATGSRFSDVLVPLAVVALIAGGAAMFRVRLLWFRGRSGSTHSPRRDR